MSTTPDLRDCIHCGLCLAACPTYGLLGTEADSPRGRIYLMREVAEGRIDPADAEYGIHIDSCLVCRACETACPSGVSFGPMMEDARAGRLRARPSAFLALSLAIVGRPSLLRLAARVGREFQRRPMLARAIPRRLRETFRLLPRIPRRSSWEQLDRHHPRGDRPRVGLLRGCVADVLFADVTRATIRVLDACGFDVVLLSTPCCGALEAHSGIERAARTRAMATIRAAELASVETVLTTAAGCGSAMKEYERLFLDDPAWRERARTFSRRVRDVTEFLATAPLPPLRPIGESIVAYHDACHLAHGQSIRREPRALLSGIPGLAVAELDDGERCCGSAGIYNITHPALAAPLAALKLDAILAAGARAVSAANPGCLIQIASEAQRRGIELRVCHPVELIAEALPSSTPSSV